MVQEKFHGEAYQPQETVYVSTSCTIAYLEFWR